MTNATQQARTTALDLVTRALAGDAEARSALLALTDDLLQYGILTEDELTDLQFA